MNQPRSSITGRFGPKVDSEGYAQFLGQLVNNPDSVLDRLIEEVIESHVTAMIPGIAPFLKGIMGSDPHGKVQRGLQQIGGAHLPID